MRMYGRKIGYDLSVKWIIYAYLSAQKSSENSETFQIWRGRVEIVITKTCYAFIVSDKGTRQTSSPSLIPWEVLFKFQFFNYAIFFTVL